MAEWDFEYTTGSVNNENQVKDEGQKSVMEHCPMNECPELVLQLQDIN